MTSSGTRSKTIVMLTGLALVTSLGTACFGLFSSDSSKSKAPAAVPCDGLTGQAKIDCEKQNAR